jgi:purine-binding chemotaxis protein CheW
MKTFVTFRTGAGHFAVDVDHSREVTTATGVTPLPAPRDGVVGILPRSEGALTVVRLLGAGDGRVLVLEAGGRTAGLLVESVTGVVSVDESAIGPAPDGQVRQLVTGVLETDDGVLLVIDAAAVLERLAP